MGLVAGTKVGSLRLNFEAEKWPVHVMGRDLNLRLVAGISPLVCAIHEVGVKVVWLTFAVFEWSAHTKGVVPAAIPGRVYIRDWSQPGLVPRTVHIERFEVQVAGTSSRNSNQFEFVGLVAGTKAALSLRPERNEPVFPIDKL